MGIVLKLKVVTKERWFIFKVKYMLGISNLQIQMHAKVTSDLFIRLTRAGNYSGNYNFLDLRFNSSIHPIHTHFFKISQVIYIDIYILIFFKISQVIYIYIF